MILMSNSGVVPSLPSPTIGNLGALIPQLPPSLLSANTVLMRQSGVVPSRGFSLYRFFFAFEWLPKVQSLVIFVQNQFPRRSIMPTASHLECRGTLSGSQWQNFFAFRIRGFN